MGKNTPNKTHDGCLFGVLMFGFLLFLLIMKLIFG